MEEIALGEMQMTTVELNAITPRALFNKLYGHRAARQEDWERTRIQTYLLLSPYYKEGEVPKMTEIMPFPWDAEAEKEKTDPMEAAKKRAEQWARVDKMKKKKSNSTILDNGQFCRHNHTFRGRPKAVQHTDAERPSRP